MSKNTKILLDFAQKEIESHEVFGPCFNNISQIIENDEVYICFNDDKVYKVTDNGEKQGHLVYLFDEESKDYFPFCATDDENDLIKVYYFIIISSFVANFINLVNFDLERLVDDDAE